MAVVPSGFVSLKINQTHFLRSTPILVQASPTNIKASTREALFIGGGGRSRTGVRKPSALGSTCLADSIYLIACYPNGRENGQRVRKVLANPHRTSFIASLCSRRLGLSAQALLSQTAPYWVLSSECVVVFVGNYNFAAGFTRLSAPRHAPQVS